MHNEGEKPGFSPKNLGFFRPINQVSRRKARFLTSKTLLFESINMVFQIEKTRFIKFDKQGFEKPFFFNFLILIFFFDRKTKFIDQETWFIKNPAFRIDKRSFLI